MKKFTVFILILVLLVSAVSCNTKPEETKSSDTEAVTTEEQQLQMPKV